MFLKLGKQGSTLAGVMDAFSIAISIALQYGVPLETYVQKFTNMRFEPAGMTDDPDIRMAQSVMDYIFRRLALDYLPYETRADAGHLHRRGAGRPGQPDQVRTRRPADRDEEVDLEALAQSVRRVATRGRRRRDAGRAGPAGQAHRSTELLESLTGHVRRRAAVHDLRHEDAPGRQLLRLRGLRHHQRLQLTTDRQARRNGAGSRRTPTPRTQSFRCEDGRNGVLR